MNDPADALESLTKMRNRRLITEQEFQAKRTEIMARLTPALPPPVAHVAHVAPEPTKPEPVRKAPPREARPAAATKPPRAPTPGQQGQRMVRKYQARSEARAEQLMANDREAAGYQVEARRWRAASPIRIVVPPAILLVAGYVLAETAGLVIAAIFGILYMLYLIAAGGVLTVTYRRSAGPR
ncbi:MAG TPA: hypothetical protein VIF63_00500 [Candidatus Limnocylindrales bacterium]|jgi:hypothetical protein